MSNTTSSLALLLVCGMAFGAEPITAPQAVVGASAATDHSALQQLMSEATTALNQQKFDAVGSLLAEHATLIFVDQTTVHSSTELNAAFKRWLGPDTDLEAVTFHPHIDGPAVISGDTALATGTTRDEYKLKNGQTVVVPATWSATLLRQQGSWRIASLHCGVNLVDNPILDIALKRSAQAFISLCWGIGLGALVIGAIVGMVLARRRG